MNWIKRYWILLVVGLVIVFLAYGGIAGIVSGIGYTKQIRASDKEITSLKKKIKASDTKADAAVDRARVAEEKARIERAEKEKHKARAARIEGEKRASRQNRNPPSDTNCRTHHKDFTCRAGRDHVAAAGSPFHAGGSTEKSRIPKNIHAC